MTVQLRSSAALVELLQPPSSVQLIGIMTLIVVALNVSHDSLPLLFIGAIAALVVGVLRPQVLHSPVWWLTIAVVVGVRILADWEGVDNHIILTVYWCVALGLGMLSDRALETISISGRLLVGLAFGFATYWKMAAQEFRHADFFEFTLLVDDRFRLLATRIGGLSPADYDANLSSLAAIGSAERAPLQVDLISTSMITGMAVVLTVATIVVEFAVAAVFLMPLRDRWHFLRPAVLLAFCFFTYLIVPVGGFGLLLLTIAAADPHLAPHWRNALLIAFAALIIYIPLWPVLTGLAG